MDCEVIVVGAGIVGLAIARELTCRGICVVMLEAERPGAGQSGGDARIFRLTHDRAEHIEQAKQALAGWRRWESELGTRLLRRCGLLVSGPTAATRHALLAEAGVPARLFTAAALTDRLPGPTTGVLLEDKAGATIALAETIEALARGLVIRQARVTAVTEHHDDVVVYAEDGRRRVASAAVVAAGRGTQQLALGAGLSIPGGWHRHTRLTYRPRPGAATGRWSAWTHRDTANEGDGFYALPVPGGGYAVGLSSYLEDPSMDEVTADEWHARLRSLTDDLVGRRMPQLTPPAAAAEDCVYWRSDDLAGHDGTVIYGQGRIRWLMSVNAAKMAPEIGARVAAVMADVARDHCPGESSTMPEIKSAARERTRRKAI